MMGSSISYFAVSAAAALVLIGSDSSVAATTNANAAAPQTVQLTASSKVAQLLTLPDATILVAPDGQRMSVGQMRALQATRVASFNELTHGGVRGASTIVKHTVQDRFAQARSDALAFAATRPSLSAGSTVSGSMATFNHAAPASTDPPKAVARPVIAAERGPDAPTPLPAVKALPTFTSPSTTAVMNFCPLDAHIIQDVNMKKTGIPFTPGGSYSIAGCGFGTAGGSVTLRASGVTIPLIVAGGGWDSQRLLVQLPADFGGVEDRSDVMLTVVPNGKAAITSGPNRFVAARETVPLHINGQPTSTFFNGDSWPAQPVISQDPTTFTVQRSSFVDGFCPQPDSSSVDTWHVDRIPLPDSQWYIADATVTNTTPQTTVDNFVRQEVLTAPMTFGWNGDALVVKHQMFSKYYKKIGPLGGQSGCVSSYTMTLLVNGPRGVTPIAQ